MSYLKDNLDLNITLLSLNPGSCSEANRNKIVVLMSGGVDSSVAALLLKEAGWDVVGLTMRLPQMDNTTHDRPDYNSEAMSICRKLGIPHYLMDVEILFQKVIIEPFQHAYLEGRTPNPCVDCNANLKFGLVWDFIQREFSTNYLATGHYARIVDSCYLAKAIDESKDQSYFLYRITASRLPYLVFPLGDMNKQTVRSLADRRSLPVAEKKDSMELCFAGEGDYRQALFTREEQGKYSKKIGDIIDINGKILGRHSGIWNYTIGQRQGLGIAIGKPLYVIRICPKDNTIIVGTREDAYQYNVQAKDINILIPDKLKVGQLLYGKIRSYCKSLECKIVAFTDTAISVKFEMPQFAPSAGQHLVLYDSDGRIVVGGVIY